MNTIGRYELERELGRGGMAVVYLARDPAMKRQVAIKILPREFTFDALFRARFQREAEVIAALEHSYIVPIYDIGEEDNQPYLVMRYLPGGTLQDKLLAGPLDLATLDRIITRLADALAEAHGRQIVHRDLKPANVLFDARHEAYLSDFGIAKVSESVAFTGTGILGTPEYMSPEQARGIKDLDRRSDVYSLGIVIFQALTGQMPYRAETPMGAAVAHITEPVPEVLRFKPDLPPACDALIRGALAKNPNERFSSAEEVARAMHTIVANPNATLVLPAQVSVPPPAPATVVTPVVGQKGIRLALQNQRQFAPETIIESWLPLKGHQDAVWGIAFSPNSKLLASASSDQTVRLWFPEAGMTHQILRGHTDAAWCVAFSPDGNQLVSGGRDNLIHIWDAMSGRKLQTWVGTNAVVSVAYNPDGQTIAAGNGDGVIQLWSVTSGQLTRTLRGHSGRVSSLVYSPDGRVLASGGSDGMVRLWNASGLTGQLRPPVERQTSYIWSLAFSRDGHWLACSANQAVRLWDYLSGKLTATLEGHSGSVNGLGFSPDVKWLASGGDDKKVNLWDMATSKVACVLEEHTAAVNGVAFSPDGRYLAAASESGIVQTWMLP